MTVSRTSLQLTAISLMGATLGFAACSGCEADGSEATRDVPVVAGVAPTPAVPPAPTVIPAIERGATSAAPSKKP